MQFEICPIACRIKVRAGHFEPNAVMGQQHDLPIREIASSKDRSPAGGWTDPRRSRGHRAQSTSEHHQGLFACRPAVQPDKWPMPARIAVLHSERTAGCCRPCARYVIARLEQAPLKDTIPPLLRICVTNGAILKLIENDSISRQIFEQLLRNGRQGINRRSKLGVEVCAGSLNDFVSIPAHIGFCILGILPQFTKRPPTGNWPIGEKQVHADIEQVRSFRPCP